LIGLLIENEPLPFLSRRFFNSPSIGDLAITDNGVDRIF
jgi:hypothetical protein